MRVTHAYCVELGEVVTIDAARRAYLAVTPPPPRFHFLCSDPICRESGVVITARNYTLDAEEGIKYKAAHFAATRHAKDACGHHDDCEWVRAAAQEASEEPLPGETPEQTQQRKARRKLSDLITHFDPQDTDNEAGGNDQADHSASAHSRASGQPRRAAIRSDGASVRTRTSVLERLALTYLEAREKLTAEEMDVLRINVGGVGPVRLVDYFRPIKFCGERTTNAIIYGGAWLAKRYADGSFRLRFFDKIANLPAFLYVSKAQLAEYRHHRYLQEIADKIPQRRFVRVFANGVLRRSETGKSLNLQISHLRHLALILGPARESYEPTDDHTD